MGYFIYMAKSASCSQWAARGHFGGLGEAAAQSPFVIVVVKCSRRIADRGATAVGQRVDRRIRMRAL